MLKKAKLIRPVKGHFAKSKLALKKHLREFRMDSVEDVKVGDEFKADVFRKRRQSRYPRNFKRKRIPRRYKDDMVNQEDLWDMALCITEDQVQWDQHLHQVEYSKVRNLPGHMGC